MTSLNAFLKDYYAAPDDQPVTLTVSTTLGVLRQQHATWQALDVQSLAPAGATTARPDKRKTPAAKGRSVKKPRPAARKAGKKGNGRLSQKAILDAVAAGHTTAPAIAAALKGNQRQISNALSRYLKAGQVRRVGVGEYALA